MPFVAPTLLTSEQSPSAVVRFGGGSKLGTGSAGPFAICSSAEILSNNGLIEQVTVSGNQYFVELEQDYADATDIRVTIKSPFTTISTSGPGTIDGRITFVRDVANPLLYTINAEHYGPYVVDDSVIQTTGSVIVTTQADSSNRNREGFAVIWQTIFNNTTASWGDTVDIMFEVVS